MTWTDALGAAAGAFVRTARILMGCVWRCREDNPLVREELMRDASRDDLTS